MFTSIKVLLSVGSRIKPALAISQGALLFDQPRPCIFDRGSNETPRAIEPIPERTRQDYSLQKYSLGLGFPGSTLPGSDQSDGTVRPGRSFEQESQTASKIEFRVLVTLETLTFYSNATTTIRSAHFIPPELPRLLPS